jgi:hypothetical protein
MIKYKDMKKYIIPLLLILFVSCEKVITIDLDQIDQEYVIEGVVDASNSKAKVIITTSRDFYESQASENIDGAKVVVTNLKSNISVTLSNISDGVYEAPIEIIDFSEYKLEVDIEGNVFTAKSFLNTKPEVVRTEFDNDDDVKIITILKDVKGYENYFRCKVFDKSGMLEKKIFLASDDEDLDDEVKFEMDTHDAFKGDNEDLALKIGDTLKLVYYSYDKSTYDYYYFLEQNLVYEGKESDNPANPKNNFDKEVLGYFSAHYSVSQTEIIKE